MAKQMSALLIQGTLDNMTFYKSKDGYMVKKKSSVSAKRIASDPAFARTRENNSAFGVAGRGGKLMRLSISRLLENASDCRMVGRLVKQLMACIKADSTNARASRTIQDGDLTVLTGFEFNMDLRLGPTLIAPYTTSYTRATGAAEIRISSLNPSVQIKSPASATHFQLVMGASALDFAAGTYDNAYAESSIMPLNAGMTPAVTLSAGVPAATSMPVMMVLGIRFYNQANGVNYPVGSGGSLRIVAVNQ